MSANNSTAAAPLDREVRAWTALLNTERSRRGLHSIGSEDVGQLSGAPDIRQQVQWLKDEVRNLRSL